MGAAGVIVDGARHTPRRDQDRGAAAQAGAQGGRWCFYLMSHHQRANQAVPMMAVMAVEINNESAASLIQSVTSSPFPVGSIAQGF
jgi:hypothetical protein